MQSSFGDRVTRIFPSKSSCPVFRSALGSTGPIGTHPFHLPPHCLLHPSQARQPSPSPLIHQSSLYTYLLCILPLIHPSIHPPMIFHPLGPQGQTFQAEQSAPQGFAHLKITEQEHWVGAEWGQDVYFLPFLPSPSPLPSPLCPSPEVEIMSRAPRSRPESCPVQGMA